MPFLFLKKCGLKTGGARILNAYLIRSRSSYLIGFGAVQVHLILTLSVLARHVNLLY